MRWDEEQFGREYDLDVFNIVAVADFNMGAMENKGLNVFNSKCAWPPTSNDLRSLAPMAFDSISNSPLKTDSNSPSQVRTWHAFHRNRRHTAQHPGHHRPRVLSQL
jgi:hypothetical protein